MLKRLFTFKGLLSRSELLGLLALFVSLLFCAGILLAFVASLMGWEQDAVETLIALLTVPSMLVYATLAVRRLRDIGAHPLVALGLLIPVVQLAVLGYLLLAPGWQDRNGVRHLLRALRVVADAEEDASAAQTACLQGLFDDAFSLPKPLQAAALTEWQRVVRPPSEFPQHLQRFIKACKGATEVKSTALAMLVAMAAAGGAISRRQALLLDEAQQLLQVEPPLPPALDAMLGMAARMCKADGPVQPSHIQVLDSFFGDVLSLTPGQRAAAVQRFAAAKASAVPFESHAAAFMAVHGQDQPPRQALFGLLLALAHAGGDLSAKRIKLLDDAARCLHILPDGAQGSGSTDAPAEVDERHAATLGVPPDAPWDEIRRAYRSAMARSHPDKVAGLSAAIREAAEAEAKRLNEAYEHFRGRYAHGA